MTDRQQISKREAQAPSATGAQDVQKVRPSDTDTIFVPDVDIREDAECIRLEANMPGVDPNSVDVSVENGVLTIEGRPMALRFASSSR